MDFFSPLGIMDLYLRVSVVLFFMSSSMDFLDFSGWKVLARFSGELKVSVSLTQPEQNREKIRFWSSNKELFYMNFNIFSYTFYVLVVVKT